MYNRIPEVRRHAISLKNPAHAARRTSFARTARGLRPALLVGVAGAVLSLGAPAGRAQNTPATPPEPMFTIDGHAEMPITRIIDLIRKDMGIQIVYADDLSDKNIYLPAPISIPASRELQFLTYLLELKGYTLVRNEFGVYSVVAKDANLPAGNPLDENPFNTTQVIDTKGFKPSSIQQYVGVIGGLTNAIYSDELGIIIVTDSPNKIQQLRDLVEKLTGIRKDLQFIRFDVKNIAATTARDRLLGLIGESTPGGSTPLGAQQQLPQAGLAKPGVERQGTGGSVTGGASSNLSFQLSVDPQSNSLLFRGRQEDADYVRQLLDLVDVPNQLISKFYDVGIRAAEVIAYQGQREGLGDVTTYQSSESTQTGAGTTPGVNIPRPGVQNPSQPFGQQGQQASPNGAGFVVYPEAGGFMYHGTPEQHARVNALKIELADLSKGDLIVMEFYKLKNAKSEDVIDVINNLLGGQGTTGNRGSILGGDLSRGGRGTQGGRNSRSSRSSRTGLNQPAETNRPSSTNPSSAGGGLASVEGDEETSVIEDQKNNQVIVKARQRLQPEFAKLITKLDSRRPQVYINAQIIAVTDNENSRLAVESQIIAGQFGLNTNFGLSSFNDFFGSKTVATGLPAFTAALVQSKYVPFIITAMQNNTDSKILATPQLLVDDNEAASVVSEMEFPTTVTQTPDTGPPITSVGDPSRAGTSLEVTPQISENAVKLDVYIEQSSFIGEPTATLPPPTQRNTVSSLVSVPRDCTIVIGGLTVDSTTKTVVKVPLLGDIPIAGLLFRDTSKRNQRATLYVFITPTIMTDPNFADLRLLTKGPAAAVDLDSDHILPPPRPVRMEIGDPIMPAEPPPSPEQSQPDLTPPPPSEPHPSQPVPIEGKPGN